MTPSPCAAAPRGSRAPGRRRDRAALVLLAIAAGLALTGCAGQAAFVPGASSLQAIVPGTTPGEFDRLQWGVNAASAGWGSQMGRIQGGVRALGARMIREEIDWSTVEPEQGVWDWQEPDELLLSAAEHGLTVLPILMLTPSWAGSNEHEIPADPSEFAEYVSHVVARYGPHGSFWDEHSAYAQYAPTWFEIWNEPYYTYFSDGEVNAARYARLVAAAGAAGHATDPSAKFLIEATSEWDTGTHWTSWVDSMYEAVPDLNDYFDGVAVHPYGKSFTDPDESNGFYQDLNDVREQFVAHGAAEKPFWITEIGYPTCAAGKAAECYTEAEQAQKLQTLNTLLTSTYKSYVRHALVYDYSDYSEPDAAPQSAEEHYGLIQLNGTPKPAYNTLKTAIEQDQG